ncbi:uncharacterized protein [Kogia breviceps]|uniref:uncharacterized protein isoform X7 n=1 Tax=Kogia breviceps TaxID=27615 RepID=UPI0034D2B191
MEKGFRFATDFKHPCLPSAEVKTFYASTLPITTFPLPDHSLGANRGYMDPGCCKQEDVQGTSEGGRGCWSCCSHFGTLRHLSSLRPASGVPSGLTVDSGCSLTAARWQVETQREDTIDEPGGGSSPDAKSALAGISDLQPPGRQLENWSITDALGASLPLHPLYLRPASPDILRMQESVPRLGTEEPRGQSPRT